MATIAKGAEATLSLSDSVVTKERIKKGYRLQQLDEALRRKRNRAEASLLREARRAGVSVPQVLQEQDFSIRMEFIDGGKIRDALDENNCAEICRKIGSSIAKLHAANIIHGDLTTSNMILKHTSQSAQSASQQIYFIDFGLGFFSPRIEDKATDLHLLHESLKSTHFRILQDAWAATLAAYGEYDESGKVIKALTEIEKRGRYKER